MALQTSGRKRTLNYCGNLSPSPYAKLLLFIAKNFTDENIAAAKLWLSVDGVLAAQEIQEIKQASDLFRVLHSKNLIPKDGQSMEPLMQILTTISRDDLKQHVEDYCNSVLKEIDQPRCSKIRNIYRFRNAADDDSVSVTSSSSSSSNESRTSAARPLSQPPQPPQQLRRSTFHLPVPHSRRNSEMDGIDEESCVDNMFSFVAVPSSGIQVCAPASITTSAPEVCATTVPAVPQTSVHSPIHPPRLMLPPPAGQGSAASEEVIDIN